MTRHLTGTDHRARGARRTLGALIAAMLVAALAFGGALAVRHVGGLLCGPAGRSAAMSASTMALRSYPACRNARHTTSVQAPRSSGG